VIGVYGGTFDPVHYGHLRSAIEVREKLGLEELRLIPCKQPPHRDSPTVDAEKRLALLEEAVADVAELTVDDCELAREGYSFMVDTLLHIRSEKGADVPLVLVMGVDAFIGLPSWSRWQQLFDLAHIAVMMRPGWKCEVPAELSGQLQERIAAELSELSLTKAGKVCFLDVTQLEISATQIRSLIQTGSDPRYLLPDSVREMIITENLYR
jgi:nicotinate-nucleotide adenylyltransferase